MRDLNMETSLSVFIGPYVTEKQKMELNDRYWLITVALELVNFPLAIPGTKVWNAIQARKFVMKYLTAASAASKARMSEPGSEPECLIDEWTKAMILAKRGDKGDGEQAKLLSREYSDHEIAMVILSFLFASQDAMSSAIVYMFQLTADHPDVLAKIREEQYRVRGNDVDAPLTLELLDDMIYTRAVIKEVMRIMPPVIMVSVCCHPQGMIRMMMARYRFLTPLLNRSPSLKTTLFRREQWLSPLSGIRFMMRLFIPNLILSSRSVGYYNLMDRSRLPRANRRITLFGEVVRTRYIVIDLHSQ